ncbi:MAG TPA: hypothetical protein ENI08_02195 [Candidatus Dependentiae bacterium]|nr:hypothetical protein [Candidatus Dependentiae bacterium]
MQIKFIVPVKQGSIQWNNKLRDLWRHNLLNMGDGDYELIIRRPRRPKSDQQRGYYWKVIIGIIENETGMDGLEVHAYCKNKFLPHDHDSTETLSTAEAEIYYEKIRVHFLTEFSIKIALPNEVNY